MMKMTEIRKRRQFGKDSKVDGTKTILSLEAYYYYSKGRIFIGFPNDSRKD
jgi:hypothetical protein